ncbi:hypothetical protein L3Q82_020531, partial [Scortum barcoo]
MVILSDVKKCNNRETFRTKMDRTFALRRQEVICDAPMISNVQERWSALFDAMEINAEFKRITTMPLQSRFLSQLDLLSESLLRVFAKRSGEQGKKLKDIAPMMTVVAGDWMEDQQDQLQNGTLPMPASSLSLIHSLTPDQRLWCASAPVVKTVV